jgi:DNA-binding MarR family transcriptional regulator
MDIGTRRDLQLLEAVAADQKVTQRNLADRLGIALGLTNLYLKRLVRKGYIKCVNVNPNRILYLITPKGITEKARLTYMFIDYSLQLYKDVRAHLRDVIEPLARNGASRIAIYGTGEAAELAYLSLRELGLEPVAIYGEPALGTFLGITIRNLESATPTDFDYLLLASLEDPTNSISPLVFERISKEKILFLRKDADLLASNPRVGRVR